MADKVNYTINYDDQRFVDVNNQKQQALSQLNKTYDSMINQSDKYYQAQIDAAKQWGETQKKNQQEQTDFAIEQIEQQKDQAKQDYTKEQSGAYVDWQKQSNQYGANAEQMAAQGMEGTGFSESSQVSMYNTYQNRVATARESYNRAVLNYDNAIKDARLQNNSILAEIAYNALQTQLELSLEGFQYKNTLIMAKTDAGREVDNTYYGRYQDVLSQINTENALAEDVRQYNEKMAEEIRQYNASLAEEKRQHNNTLALQKAQLAEEKRQFNATHSGSSSSYTSSKGSSGGSKKSSSGGSKTSSKKSSTSSSNKSYSSGSTKKSSSSEPTVDTKSVLALGFGPISGKRLAELEASGVIQSYVSGGKVKYKKTASTLKQQMLFR